MVNLEKPHERPTLMKILEDLVQIIQLTQKNSEYKSYVDDYFQNEQLENSNKAKTPKVFVDALANQFLNR